jgi:hypothetical protein
MWRVWKGRQIHARFWRGNMKYRTLLEDLGINGSIILKWLLKNRTIGRGLNLLGLWTERIEHVNNPWVLIIYW